MAGKSKIEIDFVKPGSGGGRKRRANGKIFLIATACVLIAAVAVIAILFIGNQTAFNRIVDFGTVLKGVSVNGIDLSGKTREEALSATSGLEKSLLDGVKFTLSINGEDHPYGAADFSVVTDYNDIIEKAISYGHTGSFSDRAKAANDAKTKGMKFTVTLSVDDNTINSSLSSIKASLDKTAQDATATFTPWGHSTDGTPFTPDVSTLKAIANAHSKGKEYDGFPVRETISDTDMPNTYRYEYYKNDHFEAGYDRKTSTLLTGYKPTYANVSRFIYTQEVQGLSVDVSSVGDQIKAQIQSGKYDTITVPCTVTEPTVKLADLKKNTQLITSWTSSFSGKSHYGVDRNYNVSMMSSLINGAVIMPGQQWSVNTTAGPRQAGTKYGWHQAAGIENGGYTPQYGGGVCQLGSTTYNAAIRSGLKVVSFKHHTIPSDYEPPGLDATLSTPAPDLVLENDGTVPCYIVSYVNPLEKNVTVEVYGPSLTDPATGSDVINTFTSKYTGPYGPDPVSKVIPVGPEPFTAPDGTIIDGITMTEYQFAKDRKGITAEIWKLVYSLDGTQLSNTVYDEQVTYNTINGTLYQWTGPVVSPSPTDPTPSPVTSTTWIPPGHNKW